MLRKILSNLITFVAVALVFFFCTSGMAGCDFSEALASPAQTVPTTPSHTENVPPDHQQAAEEPSDATQENEAPTVPTQSPPLQLTKAPEGYFEDALFIGDSRTVGLQEYGGIHEAAYFATSGMSVYSIFYEKVRNTSFQDLMESRAFGKIYVMLGINELGYDFETTVKKYKALIEWIRRMQPDAIIYIQANLHVSADRSNRDSIYNNQKLDAFHSRIAELADGRQIFYLDVNPLFDDNNGNLADKYTADDTHIFGKYYRTWTEWIADNAAVKTAGPS